jgi:hypothetical protein
MPHAVQLFDRFARLLGREPRSDSSLMEFASEGMDFPSESPAEETRPRGNRVAGVLLILLGLALGAAGLTWSGLPSLRAQFAPAPVPVRMASLAVVTRPEGAHVIVDGEPRGVTPLTLEVAPGTHTVTVRSGETERVMMLDAAPGADIVREIEIVPAATTPAQASLTPVEATSRAASLIDAGAGWLSIAAPFEVQVVERGEVIGTSAARRIMLPSGRHDLLVVNRLYEFEEARRIEVTPGQTATLRIDARSVAVNINARPWAEVTVDGAPLGQTPIANAMIPIGTRRLVFRHPDFGERQQDVVIAQRPGQRVSVDLTK